MIGRIITGTVGTPFSREERTSLRSLRASYESAEHVFTERELAHLHFLRWLVSSPGWNRSMDRADNHHPTIVPIRETQYDTRVMPVWTRGSIG
jgi:hypothetical protein